MILIANGCSHTAGAEIEYPMQGDCYHKAWPKYLANSLSFDESKNLAVSGASDTRVSRTTIEYIGRLKQKPNFDSTNIFVIVSWPGLYRTEIHKNKDLEDGFWDDGWMPLVAGNDETYKKQCSPASYAYYRAWMLRLNPTQEIIKFYSNVLLLQNFLILNNIKYLFWNACANVPNNHSSFYNEVDIKRFPFIENKEYSYTSILHNKGFKHSEFAKYGHYGVDSQIWFSSFLTKYIHKNNLL
jgi:hypothetical protein